MISLSSIYQNLVHDEMRHTFTTPVWNLPFRFNLVSSSQVVITFIRLHLSVPATSHGLVFSPTSLRQLGCTSSTKSPIFTTIKISNKQVGLQGHVISPNCLFWDHSTAHWHPFSTFSYTSSHPFISKSFSQISILILYQAHYHFPNAFKGEPENPDCPQRFLKLQSSVSAAKTNDTKGHFAAYRNDDIVLPREENEAPRFERRKILYVAHDHATTNSTTFSFSFSQFSWETNRGLNAIFWCSRPEKRRQ